MTGLADACAELAALLPAAAVLIAEPDADGSAGSRPAPSSRPPWNSAAASAVTGAAEGVRRLEASMRRDVTGHTGPRRGGSAANTMAALGAIASLGHGVSEEDARHAAAIIGRWTREIRELPAIDEAEQWTRVRGAICPYCGFAMLQLARRSGRVTCLRYGACTDGDGSHPAGLVQQSVTGDPIIAWSDGYIQYGTPEESEPMDLIARVRELHRPRWYDPYSRSGQVWLTCHGCDEGAHSECPPPWPCSTAEIVYTAEEIAARDPATMVAECPRDHRKLGHGEPISAGAIFLRSQDGRLLAARWNCTHVGPVPVEPVDPWDDGHVAP